MWIPGTETLHTREWPKNKGKKEQPKKLCKLWGRGESDFQGYHIRFKCPVFKKKLQAYKESGKYDHWKGGKSINRNVYENEQNANLLDKDIKATVSQMFQLKSGDGRLRAPNAGFSRKTANKKNQNVKI